MTFSSLALRNFRSHTKKAFTFSPDCTLLTGSNAAGKTNALEAIILLSRGKSFRARREAEMITWGAQSSVVGCQLLDGEDRIKLEIVLSLDGTAKKRFTVNGVARRQIDFVGNLKTVFFWPEDLRLVTDSPSVRRMYLDAVLAQIDREYRRNAQSYERGLRQRNRLLDRIYQGGASRSQLLFWNQLLIRCGSYITDARQRFLDTINTFNIRGMPYTAAYDKSVISESRLEQYKEEEVAAKTTLVGPHRDDFCIYEKRGNDTMELSRFGSRGEQRLGALWLKFLELSYIEKITGIKPLLLLDDIFSELDKEHRAIVLGIVPLQQTIITSADSESVRELKHVAHEIIQV